jgi:hypothetical protein
MTPFKYERILLSIFNANLHLIILHGRHLNRACTNTEWMALSEGHSPFNAGIKSLRAKLPAEIFFTGDFNF